MSKSKQTLLVLMLLPLIMGCGRILEVRVVTKTA
jgi:hypothetical protein